MGESERVKLGEHAGSWCWCSIFLGFKKIRIFLRLKKHIYLFILNNNYFKLNFITSIILHNFSYLQLFPTIFFCEKNTLIQLSLKHNF
jgi:hypothetical protein